MCVFLPTEVSQFELALVVDEQVLRLKVSVEDFSLVTVGETTQELEHEDLQKNENDEDEDEFIQDYAILITKGNLIGHKVTYDKLLSINQLNSPACFLLCFNIDLLK